MYYTSSVLRLAKIRLNFFLIWNPVLSYPFSLVLGLQYTNFLPFSLYLFISVYISGLFLPVRRTIWTMREKKKWNKLAWHVDMLTPFTTIGGSEGIFPCNSIIRQVDKKARGQIKTVFCTRFDLFFQSKHLTRKMANINPGVSFHFSPNFFNRLSVANSLKKWCWQLESERVKYGGG